MLITKNIRKENIMVKRVVLLSKLICLATAKKKQYSF